MREVARQLGRHYDVTFVGDQFDADGMAGVNFLPIAGHASTGLLAPLWFRRRARRALRRERFDAVITWGVDCPPGDLLAVASVHRAWLRHGRPIPSRFGTVPNAARYLMPQHLVRLALERSYFRSTRTPIVSVLSEQNADEVKELYDVEQQRLVIIPNGYSAEEFSQARASRERAPLRQRLGLTDEDVLILLVANELHRKGFAVLLQAVAMIADPRVQVAVVGRAPIDSYRSLTERLGLGERVRWHGPAQDVAPWYGAADLFVMPSQYEAYPLVVIEALASGLPVITTALAGSLDAITPGHNGLLLSDANDAAQLAALIRQGLDKETRARWSRAAPDSVRRLEWGEIAQRYAALLDTITP